MTVSSPITEAEILERIISSMDETLPPKTARSLLEVQFPARELTSIRKLLRRNNSGAITAAERVTLENYLRVGQFLDLLHAKAKSSLAKRSRTK